MNGVYIAIVVRDGRLAADAELDAEAAVRVYDAIMREEKREKHSLS